MSDATGEVRVRNVRTQQSGNIVGTVIDAGSGALRIGLSVLTLPLAIPPAQSQQHVRNAAKEILQAAAALPGDLAAVAGKVVDDWAAAGEAEVAKKAPKDELTAG